MQLRQLAILIAITFAGVGIHVTQSLADDLYVNNVDGDDRNDGSSSASVSKTGGPLQTITRALKVAQLGDRIVLENTGVPYRESLTLQGKNNSGTVYEPFTIVGNGAVLDGTGPVPGYAWVSIGNDVYRFRPERMSYQQLYRDGRPVKQIESEGGTVPALETDQWALVRGHIYFRTQPDVHPRHYRLSYCKLQVGITLYQIENVLIDGLTVQGFQLDGINAHSLVKNTIVNGCVLRGNGRSGFSIGGSSKARILNSLIGDNGAAQTRSEGVGQLDVENCDLIDSPHHGPPVVREGGRITLHHQLR